MEKNLLLFCLIVLSFTACGICFAATGAEQPMPATAPAAVSVSAAAPAAFQQRKKATPEMYYYAGEKLYNTRKYEAASKFYFYAAKLDKNYTAAWKKLAFCYYKLNKHKYAYEAFKKVLALDKADADAADFMQYYSNLMDKAKKQKEKRGMTDPLWRAAVLPGWGQFYNNQSMKGIMVSGGVIVAGGLTAYSVVDQNIKYDKYLKTNENHDIAYREAQAAWTTALIWTIVTAVIYTGGIVDAVMNYDCLESKMIEGRINNEGTAVICANIRW